MNQKTSAKKDTEIQNLIEFEKLITKRIAFDLFAENIALKKRIEKLESENDALKIELKSLLTAANKLE
jgi:hypothetical protein